MEGRPTVSGRTSGETVKAPKGQIPVNIREATLRQKDRVWSYHIGYMSFRGQIRWIWPLLFKLSEIAEVGYVSA